MSGTKGRITIPEQLFTEWEIEGEERPADVVLGGEQLSGASVPTNLDAEGHRLHIADMADAIRLGRQPIVNGVEARRAVQLITAIYESSRTGKRVDL